MVRANTYLDDDKEHSITFVVDNSFSFFFYFYYYTSCNKTQRKTAKLLATIPTIVFLINLNWTQEIVCTSYYKKVICFVV